MDQIRVVVGVVIHDSEDLRLHTYLLKSVERIKRENAGHAEDTIVERRLVLVGSAAGTSGRMRPMNLVSLSDVHFIAMLPIVLGGEFGVAAVILVALEACTNIAC